MKKLFYLTSITLLILSACAKQNGKRVTYRAANAVSEFKIQYYDENNMLQSSTVYPESTQDIWQKEIIKEQGDIVYLSGKYNDINNSLKLQILIDGKVYKQAESKGDTVKYLTVSGTIPYDY